MAAWLTRTLKRIHKLAEDDRVKLTGKAVEELKGLAILLQPEDVREVVAGLTPGDSSGRLRSESTGDWMYVFKPEIAGCRIYLKLVLFDECLVVSFHHDEDEAD